MQRPSPAIPHSPARTDCQQVCLPGRLEPCLTPLFTHPDRLCPVPPHPTLALLFTECEGKIPEAARPEGQDTHMYL